MATPLSSPNNRTTTRYSPVLELRNYTTQPGERDTLIRLFEREFIDTQEQAGIEVLGQFRTPDDPDRFLWLRGFRDRAARLRSLQAFYGSEHWRKLRDATNATLIDSDDVLLLRPAREDSAFSLDGVIRPSSGARSIPEARLVATIHHLRAPSEDGFTEWFERAMAPELVRAGASILATFVTDATPNDYPRLPVREGVNVHVSFLGFANAAAHDAHVAALGRSKAWSGSIARELAAYVTREPETWRLSPTARSWLGSEVRQNASATARPPR